MNSFLQGNIGAKGSIGGSVDSNTGLSGGVNDSHKLTGTIMQTVLKGVGIKNIYQRTYSTESGGENIWEVELSNGTTTQFVVRNGLQGEKGAPGDPITIVGYIPAEEKDRDNILEFSDGTIIKFKNGAKGEPFTYEDFTPEQLEGLKGEKGDPFTFEDFTEEQLLTLKGEKGDAFTYEDFTEEQLAGLKGDKGDPFVFEDFTEEQLEALKGEKGDAFSFDDFTPKQLEELKGEKGDTLKFEELTDEQKLELKGEKGDAFSYEDFTEEQLASLKGEKGDTLSFEELTEEQKLELKGEKGDAFTYEDFTEDQLSGLKGDKGEAFTYEDFTEEQLAALKGEKGDAFSYEDFTEEQLEGLKGDKGDAFVYEDFTEEQLASLKGEKGDAFVYEDFTEEQLEGLKGEKGEQGLSGVWVGPDEPEDGYDVWIDTDDTFSLDLRPYATKEWVSNQSFIKSVNSIVPDDAGNVEVDVEVTKEKVEDALGYIPADNTEVQRKFEDAGEAHAYEITKGEPIDISKSAFIIRTEDVDGVITEVMNEDGTPNFKDSNWFFEEWDDSDTELGDYTSNYDSEFSFEFGTERHFFDNLVNCLGKTAIVSIGGIEVEVPIYMDRLVDGSGRADIYLGDYWGDTAAQHYDDYGGEDIQASFTELTGVCMEIYTYARDLPIEITGAWSSFQSEHEGVYTECDVYLDKSKFGSVLEYGKKVSFEIRLPLISGDVINIKGSPEYKSPISTIGNMAGQGLIAASKYQTVLGQYNEPLDSFRWKVLIGAGTNIYPSTALAIDSYNDVYVGGHGPNYQGAKRLLTEDKINNLLDGYTTITTTENKVPSANSILNYPWVKDLWHDHFAFLRYHTKVEEEHTLDGETWETVSKANFADLFSQKERGNPKFGVLTAEEKAYRFTFKNTSFAYSGVSWFELGVAYSNPFSYFDFLVEFRKAETDSWSQCHKSTVKTNSNPVFFRNTRSFDGDGWIRFTFTKTDYDNGSSVSPNGTAYITAIKAFCTRKGDQGLGSEIEYPYDWDASANVLPYNAGKQNLGTSSKKWNSVYANNFNGYTIASNVPANAKFTDTVVSDAHINELISTAMPKETVTDDDLNNIFGEV